MEILASILKNISLLELVMFIGGIAFFASRLEETSRANKELINNELKHVIHIMELNHKNLVNDINRLEKKQEESNKIKERLAMQEVLTADIHEILKEHLAESHECLQCKKSH